MMERERYSEIAYDHSDHNESRKGFGLVIRSLREERGISLKALSRKIGVNPSYVSRVENGIVPASGKLVEALADELGVSRFDLAIQSGLLGVNWNEIGASELEALKQIVDSGAFSLRD